ncbi:MAG: helix-turn-helix transcriptional regulator [Alphaproteobacteria bacterium]|nr:helix-turn-helix transcriptional regulator [Alphaproteobacteria bacterium]
MRNERPAALNDCPIEAAMGNIGGKWKASILCCLTRGTCRYGELRRMFPKASQRTLTRQLRDLEADQLIDRIVFAEVPPRVEYSLSDKGRTLQPVLEALFEWGRQNAIDEHGNAILPACADGGRDDRRDPVEDAPPHDSEFSST